MHIRYWQRCPNTSDIRGVWISDVAQKPPHNDKQDMVVRIYMDVIVFNPEACD